MRSDFFLRNKKDIQKLLVLIYSLRKGVDRRSGRAPIGSSRMSDFFHFSSPVLSFLTSE